WWACISSAQRRSRRARSCAVSARQAGSAACAAAMARSVSAAPISGTLPRLAWVAGSLTSSRRPLSASIQASPTGQRWRSRSGRRRRSARAAAEEVRGAVMGGRRQCRKRERDCTDNWPPDKGPSAVCWMEPFQVKPITADLIAQRWQAALAAPASQALNRRLYDCLRTAILDGSLPAATRLPASRELAAELAVSRNTVIDAYGQLLAEGYLRALTGSGTYVADVLPEQVLWSRRAAPLPSSTSAAAAPAAAGAPRAGLSRRGRALVAGALASPRQWGAFVLGVPDIPSFPHRKLAQITARLQRQAPPEW